MIKPNDMANDMANINNKPDISQINRFSERFFRLKSLRFLHTHYKDVLHTIKSIYSYIDRLEWDNTRLTMELNKERERAQKLQVYTALMQVEMNKQLIRHSFPYFKGVDITEIFVKDENYYEQFKQAYNYE